MLSFGRYIIENQIVGRVRPGKRKRGREQFQRYEEKGSMKKWTQ
jgi:hypothetical protein